MNKESKNRVVTRIMLWYLLFSVLYIAGMLFAFSLFENPNMTHANMGPYFAVSIVVFSAVFMYYRIRQYSNKVNLYEEQLIAAKKNAEEGDKLKSFFLSNLSHEIRTPLNNILGYSDLLLEGDYGVEEKEKYYNILENNVDRLVTVTENVIFASEVQLGSINVKKEKFLLNELLEEVCNYLKEKIKTSGKDVELYYTTILDLELNTDRKLVEKIIKPLVRNALNFTEKGRVDILVELKENNFVEIQVIDTGMGIAKNKQDDIFKAFKQVDNSRTRKNDGLGLGLHVVLSLLNILGGQIFLDSDLGKGSVFTVLLPLS